MHPTAMINCQCFFDSYATYFAEEEKVKVVDIGSQNVNGSLRSVTPSSFQYIGIDCVEGKGVDIILEDPYNLPFSSESIDIVLSSSCFEHSEMFWLAILEIMRVLKPRGLFYLNAPSNGEFHRYPVDCWRFYPDSGQALVKWMKRNSINAALLESYISDQIIGNTWNDLVAVFIKDEKFALDFPTRILDSKHDIKNGVLYGKNDFLNLSVMSEEQRKLAVISQVTTNHIKAI